MFIKTVILVLFLNYCATQVLEKPCTLSNGNSGICQNISDCNESEIEKNKTTCDLKDIICCSKQRIKSQEFCDNNVNIKTRSVRAVPVRGGQNSKKMEFPHMAALGYVNNENNITWGCGGALISHKHILTAAHCVSTKIGKLTFVRLGDLKLYTNTDDNNSSNFTIIKATRHPDFHPPSKYHDIAILELDRIVDFNNFIKPACLHTYGSIENETLTATGWGKLEYYGDVADHLQKVALAYYPHEKCKEDYKKIGKKFLNKGIVDDWQICAWKENGDTCQGDSGGPLQSKFGQNKDAWTIVGVTSFGKDCGFTQSPGIYTRVFNYIKWIESIVWSN